ncbi:MAG: molybdopterin oxidoreductase family protein, partial [Acidimicrobiales bacterium]
LTRRGNVNGALDMGLAPTDGGLDATGILVAAAAGEIDTLVLLGSDPLVDFPDRDLAQRAFARLKFVLSLDRFLTASTAEASVVLPVAGDYETDGSFTNLEGRVTALVQRVTPPGTARPDWMIAADLAWRLDADLGMTSVVGINETISREIAHYTEVFDGLAAGTVDGVVVRGESLDLVSSELDPAPSRDAYSLRLVVNRKLYGNGTATVHSPNSALLAPGAVLQVHRTEFDRLGVSDGDVVHVVSEFGSMSVRVSPNASVPRGVAVLAGNQADARAFDLLDVNARLTEIRLETM